MYKMSYYRYALVPFVRSMLTRSALQNCMVVSLRKTEYEAKGSPQQAPLSIHSVRPSYVAETS